MKADEASGTGSAVSARRAAAGRLRRHRGRRRLLIAATIMTTATWSRAGLQDLATALYANSRFLPDFYTQSDISRFFLQKDGYNDYFRTRYYVEGNIVLGFPLYSFAGVFRHTWELEVQAGMGQTPNNVVFDPMDVAFAVVPLLEAVLQRATLQLGLDHRCFHEIDRKDFLTTYYNKLFLGAGSPTYRMHDFRRMLPDDPGWFDGRRFSWYLRAGYYVKHFPGARDSTKINFNNDNVLDLSTSCRYALLHRTWVTIHVLGQTRIGFLERADGSRARESYWRQDICLETDFPVENVGGMMVFVNYTRDHLPLERGMPRFSRDELLQVGLRFSN